MGEKNKVKKSVIAHTVAVFAGIAAFLSALNIRDIALMIYTTLAMQAGRVPWGGSFVNASVLIVSMLALIVYSFYILHYFEKNCKDEKKDFIKASKKFILPVIILYIATEAIIRII